MVEKPEKKKNRSLGKEKIYEKHSKGKTQNQMVEISSN